MCLSEWMHVKPKERETLVLHSRRFVGMTLVIYAALTVGLWLAHAISPGTFGPGLEFDYVVSVSLIAALTFGGLFAAALALRPIRPRESEPARAP